MTVRRIIVRARPARKPKGIRPVAKRTEAARYNDPQNTYRPGLVLTDEQVGQALDAHVWTFARTMPQWPHFYTVREHWTSEIPWENVVQFIRERGFKGWFGKGKAPRRYWLWKGQLYWTCSLDPKNLPKEGVINRAPDQPADYFHIER